MVNPLKVMLESLGWYGAAAILFAYTAVSFGWLHPGSLVTISLNLTGAFGIIVSSIDNRAWQAITVNSFWLLVALISLFRYFWVWAG